MSESPRTGRTLRAVTEDRPPYPISSELDDDEIDIAELIGTLIENRRLILAVAFAAIALGGAYTFLATPIYQADALLQVEKKKSALGDLDINELFEGEASVNAEIEILKSRSVLGTVVDNLKLDIIAEPDFFPVFGNALARRQPVASRPAIKVDSLDVPDSMLGQSLRLRVLSPTSYEVVDRGGNLLLRGSVGEAAHGESLSLFVSKLTAEHGQYFKLRKEERIASIEMLARHLEVSENSKGSGILSIRLEGESPTETQRQVNEIANIFVRQNVERKSAEAAQTLAFLDRHLPTIKQDMEAAEVALNSYRLEKGSVDLPLETQAILESVVNVEGRLNELKQQRDKAIQAFTAIHPTVVALDRQVQTLNEELASLNSHIRDLPTTQQEVLRLVRDVEVNTALYTTLLNTAQELRVVKAGTVGNVRIVDGALIRNKPVRPRMSTVLTVSLLIGGLIGVASAFVRKALYAGVADPDLIERITNIPVYTAITHSKRQDEICKRQKLSPLSFAMLAIDCPEDSAVESLRNLRTALHFGMMDATNNCIMIAGPAPEVGKTFVSANLAAVLTSNDERVLLIDADMRRGHLHSYLGMDRKNGLSDFISGKVPIGQCLHQTKIRGLTFVPTGELPPNPAELLLHQRFSNLLTVLSPRFDRIIIDSPPVLAVTDATVIGQLAGATLLVLKAGRHPLREIEQCVKRLQQANVNLRGVVLNDIPRQGPQYGVAKYSYQYSY